MSLLKIFRKKKWISDDQYSNLSILPEGHGIFPDRSPVGAKRKSRYRGSACPVKFMSMRSEANFTGVGPEDGTGVKFDTAFI
jgi:hypothetical protein